ncbi:MAG: PIG-L family deacetylase [bacterium]
MTKRTVLAVAAHPDDIEFMMAGTLILLKEKGCSIHYFTLTNGCCGSAELSKKEIVRIREEEARAAARFLGATFHPSLVDDFQIFYSDGLIRKVAAVVRECRPEILLVPSLVDYMEDHSIAARIAVTAAFVRGMPNYETDPSVPPISNGVVVYHALPHGLKDPIRRSVLPELFVDIASVIDRKVEMLRLHASQKEWLDRSQGMDSYVETMREMSRTVGEMSERFRFAEGWRRHSHLGFADEDADPLSGLLEATVFRP